MLEKWKYLKFLFCSKNHFFAFIKTECMEPALRIFVTAMSNLYVEMSHSFLLKMEMLAAESKVGCYFYDRACDKPELCLVTSVSALQKTLIIRVTTWKGQPSEKVVDVEGHLPRT